MKISLLLTLLFFNGCQKAPCEPEKVYIKASMPKLRVLYPIKPFKITDLSTLDDRYYRVNKEQLKMAASVSQKKTKNIAFYESQNIKFNSTFHKEEK